MKVTGTLLTAGLVLGGTLGTLAITNKFTENQAGELGTTLTGEERRYPWKDGDIFYKVNGSREAKPLLLIHGFAPGASSYEWRKNVDTLSHQFRVYVLDLMGFGLSDRPAIDYTAETYADLISDFLKEVIGKPAIVVAHGLTCAYVIADAFRRPQLFERLILVSPPSTILKESNPGPLNTALKFVLRAPIVGEFIYNLMTSRRAIRSYYERHGYYNSGLISDEMVEYVFSSAHQGNNRFAMASFLSNYLIMDVHEPLARLRVPVVAIWARKDVPPSSETTEAFTRINSRIDVRTIDNCNQQLQDEQASKFNAVIREFASTGVTQ